MPNRGGAQVALMLEVLPVCRIGSTPRGYFVATVGHGEAVVVYIRHQERGGSRLEQMNLLR